MAKPKLPPKPRTMIHDLAYDGDVEENQRRRRHRQHDAHLSLIPTVYEPFDRAEVDPPRDQRQYAARVRGELAPARAHRSFAATSSPRSYEYHDRRLERRAPVADGPQWSTAPAPGARSTRRHGEGPYASRRADGTPPERAAREPGTAHHTSRRSRTTTTASLNDWMVAGDKLFGAAPKSQRRSHTSTDPRVVAA